MNLKVYVQPKSGTDAATLTQISKSDETFAFNFVTFCISSQKMFLEEWRN